MPTSLFEDIIFGPVRSRRLGVSLGINLLPQHNKYCNFNCIYCECGWTSRKQLPDLPPFQLVHERLEQRLSTMHQQGEPLDVITFAGNGEPTMHPHFADVVDSAITLRDRYYPEAKVVVLSNASMLTHPRVAEALRRVDKPVLKLDSAIDSTFQLINGPLMPLTAQQVIGHLLDFGHDFTLQTLFLRGQFDGQRVDNTTELEVGAWLAAVEKIRPRDVMIYTLDRDTPASGLVKVPMDDLQSIARRVEALGIPTQVRG